MVVAAHAKVRAGVFQHPAAVHEGPQGITGRHIHDFAAVEALLAAGGGHLEIAAIGIHVGIADFVDTGILLPRTKQMLHEELSNYIVYEIDGAVRACASLIEYKDGQMEIAGVAVDKAYSHTGIGPKLVEHLIKRAKEKHAKKIFLLTTRTADWFENLGFIPGDINDISEERKKLWTPERGSKVLYYSKH